MKILYSFFIFLLFATTTIAQDVTNQNDSPNYLLELSASFGGDEFGTILFENEEDQKILSGNGLTFAAGIDYPLAANQLGVKAALGYKVSFSKADNADIKKSAIPLDIIPYIQLHSQISISG